jgi:hypothetical protein
MTDKDANSTVDDNAYKRFCIAVENFVDLYKFIMVLAIGNCVRSLAQRQIQPLVSSNNGLTVHISTVSLFDWMMFVSVLIFIARFFLGDMGYWKVYGQKNRRLQVSDVINLLVNSILLTYLSFFIGYTHMLAFVILLVLVTEILWAALRGVEGIFRKTEGPLSPEIGLGLAVSFFTVFIIFILMGSGRLPTSLPDGVELTSSENWWILGVITFNNMLDLVVNGGRYLGVREHSWGVLRLVRRD